MASVLKTIIKLRRDTLLNYSKVGTHVPLKGEVCFVDSIMGLRVKVGDGVTSFNQLAYNDSMVIGGYYNSTNGKFYKESSFTNELEGSENVLYIDKPSSVIYYWNGVNYIANKTIIPNASSTEPGIMKLYSTYGQNTDGTMTQKAITDAINDIAFDVEIDGADNVMVLAKPW